eukprot:NODE_108_length_18904_cov_0.654826.p10 type:complete len:301 gc:universal NODE_108_length_18904_cov_0.654826:7216-6314(-)
MSTLSIQEMEKIEKASSKFVEEISNIKEVISKDELKEHLLSIIKMEFEGISEKRLADIYDITLKRDPSMQVLISLQSTNLSSTRALRKEIRGIKAMLEEDKLERIKLEQEAKKSQEEVKEWQSEAAKLKLAISDLIYVVCISDIIKHLPDKLAEFYKNNNSKFNIPKTLKSKEIDVQWSILYGYDCLKKAQVDFSNYSKDNMDSIGSYQILLLDIIKKHSEQEDIPFRKVLIDGLVLKKERNLDLHLKLDDSIKDALDIFNKLENSILRNIAKIIEEDQDKMDTLNELWTIAKYHKLYNK